MTGCSDFQIFCTSGLCGSDKIFRCRSFRTNKKYYFSLHNLYVWHMYTLYMRWYINPDSRRYLNDAAPVVVCLYRRMKWNMPTVKNIVVFLLYSIYYYYCCYYSQYDKYIDNNCNKIQTRNILKP